MNNGSNNKKDKAKIKYNDNKDNIVVKTKIKNEKENTLENKAGLNKINEKLYLDFKSYLKNICPSTNEKLLKEKSVDDFRLHQMINEFQSKEKRLFYGGNNDIIYKYFLCKQLQEFDKKDLLIENQNITKEFRFFSLYLFFGNNNNMMLNFYSKLFLNSCKIVSSSILNNNVNKQKCLKHINSSKDSLEWIYIIPCFEFPILKNELIKLLKSIHL